MCDCYGHKCELCDELIPMHIGDFKFPRENFKVWCEKHIAQAHEGAVIFESIQDDDNYLDEGYSVGWKCAIYGPEVGDDGNNSPNIGMKMKELMKR